MSLQKIYLTIDDSPSIHMDKKVLFLKKHNIPAVFYARGEFIAKHPNQIINAIQNGFLIGNHSYSHPFFSEIPLEKCIEEIERTERLIENCYQKAKIQRPKKIIRLPYGDRGAGEAAKPATNQPQKQKTTQIQDYLHLNGFKPLSFSQERTFIDAFWDWDTKDYKRKHIENTNLYLSLLEDSYTSYTRDTAILLLHDFDHNHHLFELTIEFLQQKDISFSSIS